MTTEVVLWHECSLRLILNNHESSFVELLWETNNIPNHKRNSQVLLTGVFKATKNLAPPIMEDMFNGRPNTYNSRKSKTDLRL